MGPFLFGDFHSPDFLGNMNVIDGGNSKKLILANQAYALTNRSLTCLPEDSVGLKGII